MLSAGVNTTNSPEVITFPEVKHYYAVPEMVCDLVKQLTDTKNSKTSATARLGQFEVTIAKNYRGRFFIRKITDLSHAQVQHYGVVYKLGQLAQEIQSQLFIINQTGHNIVLESTIHYG